MDAVPDELLAVSRHETSTSRLNQEMATYVPVDEAEMTDMADPGISASGTWVVMSQSTAVTQNFTGVIDLDHDEEAHDYSMEDIGKHMPSTKVVKHLRTSWVNELEPAVFPLQALGVIDVGATDVPDSDLLAHALANTTNAPPKSFQIRRGSAFVNEYARTDDETQQRTDGGPNNPNHLLGTFPVLFPYGMGGFEVARNEQVPYEVHARWALQYADRRFRKDLYFVFQVFGVIQKRRICRAAVLQMKKSAFTFNQAAIRRLTPQDLLIASAEETRRVAFSNPAVQSLRTNLTAMRARVPGTDESRKIMRSQIWSMSVMHNPPSLWLTLNPSDTNSPIAQVLAGVEIDMDHFNVTAGPDSAARSVTIARDPYAAAKFFHFVIKVILEDMFGITTGGSARGGIKRQQGVLGKILSYIGSVEAQGRGTLHLHMLLWLQGGPTAAVMKQALLSTTFRDKMVTFIEATVMADLSGATTHEVESMPRVKSVGYARPVDPRLANYLEESQNVERATARTVQLHTCKASNCLIVMKNRTRCKRRAPFELATKAWVTEAGRWGPRRTCAFMNNWCPSIMQILHSNHDIKIITNGAETKDITWYITVYASKKQHKSGNTSALLAKRVAFHKTQERHTSDLNDVNRRMLQRCANTLSREQEFSAPEVINYLMGWGDRVVSHNFVSIYLDSVLGALKSAYPALRNQL